MLVGFEANSQSVDYASSFEIASIGQFGKSLTLKMINRDTSSVITQPTLVNDPTQIWKFVKSKSGHLRIYNLQQGSVLCLSLYKDKKGQFKFSFVPPKDQSGQMWRLAVNREGTARIINLWMGNESCVEVLNDGELAIKEMNDKPNQFWKMTPSKMAFIEIPTDETVSPVPNATAAVPIAAVAVTNSAKIKSQGNTKSIQTLDTAATYRIFTDEMEGKSIGVVSFNGRATEAMLMPDQSGRSQEWKFKRNENGQYHIFNAAYANQILEAKNDMVVLSEPNNNPEQLWKVVLTPSGMFQITSVAQGDSKPLDFVEDGEEKSAIQLRENNSTLWTLLKRSKNVVAKPVNTNPVSVNPVSAYKNQLMPGETLKVNMKLTSSNGEYTLVQQEDGNLVIYNKEKSPVWSTNMNGKSVKRTVMQKDGNLVQYLAYDLAKWSTNTNGNPGAIAQLQDDGILVILKGTQLLWSSK